MARALRIGIDARALVAPVTGTGVYLRELLRELAVLAPDLKLFCYSTKCLAEGSLPQPGSVERLGEGVMARWGTLWLQTAVPRLALTDRVDLFWGPLQVLPRRLIYSVPTVVTVHDLVFRRYRRTMSWRNQAALALLAASSMRSATRVVAVSRTTARDAIAELGLEPTRVSVVRNAVSSEFSPVRKRDALKRVEEALGLSEPYLLFVGTLEPRKNLTGLLDALDVLASDSRFDGQLLIVGGEGWQSGALRRQITEHPLRSRLVFAGYVEQELLPSLYSGARAFVMPSIYEGFGLPVLEAMSCGLPVVCSDVDPFPEVAGDAALRVAPGRPDDLARALVELWTDKGLREALRQKGFEQAARFRWSDSAAQLLRVFEEAIDAGP